MDINQSALSQSKLNKPGIARSTSENKAIAEANRSKDIQNTPVITGKNQTDLKEGQIVKGQILDHRYNEVQLQIEPGKQIITAKLSGDVPLSIGQKAQFAVTEDGSDRFMLKYLPESTSASDATIQMALSASGLPTTDRNRALVEELLNHTMPVDKQTLQTLIRISNMNREASPLTLVLMFKNNLPMTSANIRQFEAYQSGSNQLLKNIQDIANNLSKLLYSEPEASGDNSSTPYLNLQNPIGESTANQNTSFLQSLKLNEQLLNILFSNDPSGIAKSTSINQVLNREDLQLLTDTLVQKSTAQLSSDNNSIATFPSDLLAQLKEGTLPFEETMKLAARLYPDAPLLNTYFPNTSDSGTLYPDVSNSGTFLLNTPVPDIVLSLTEQYSYANDPSTPLSSILSHNEQASFAEMLSVHPSLQPLVDQIVTGSTSVREVLSQFQNNLPGMADTDILKLIASPSYQSLMEHAFHDKWTITPENLADKSKVKELYDHLIQDMDKLTKLGKLSFDESRLQEPMKDIQENLHFLKDLNEMFTYLQLPIQLKNQDVHSELYVYSNKKSLQSKENISVLLHLDMTHLGSMNIHIQMDHNIVRAKFYMETSEAKALIEEHIPSLTDTLRMKGYHLQSFVDHSYEKPDFTKDFIEDSVKEGEVKRYTFDIRT